MLAGIFTDASDGCSIPSDTISKSIRNVSVLVEFRMVLGLEDRKTLDVRSSFSLLFLCLMVNKSISLLLVDLYVSM